MATFDPNAAAGETSGVFGLPYGEEESALVIVPVPWEATTSYGGGAAQGPGRAKTVLSSRSPRRRRWARRPR